MSKVQVEDPYDGVAPLLKLATDWLDRSEHTNVPLELAVHELRWRGDWRLSIYRTPRNIEGVSVVLPRGDWFLEGDTSSAAVFLANLAVVQGQRPATLTTSERVSVLVRPVLFDRGVIDREHSLRMLRCTQPPDSRAGRWATAADLPELTKYEKQIDRDQKGRIDTSWEGLIARQELAVLAVSDSIVASIRRYGPAPSFAAIADLCVLPQSGRSDIAAQLTGFVVAELLVRRKAVYVFVDESDIAALAFYRTLGFVDLGACYKADFK